MKKTTRLLIVFGIGIVIIAISTIIIINNRVTLSDLFRGAFYHPTAEMETIRDKLSLTSDGIRIFNASFPELETSESFNLNCESHDSEIYILGCYADGDIHVYDIRDKQFDGIRELTSAHELLHAVYARLPESEKLSLSVQLEEVYRKNTDILGEELKLYESSQRYDELHSRIGTEIKDLPSNLEEYYGKYFKDQDQIVSYYNNYIEPFRKLKAEFTRLEDELSALGDEIETIKLDYESRSEAYNTSVKEFNRCASTADCFASDYEFRTRRAEILAEQSALNALFVELNQKITLYNSKVEEYNNNILKNEELTNIVNSNAKVESL